MAEQELDGAHVGAGLEQMAGERVAQRVGGQALGNAGQAQGSLAGLCDGVAADMAVGTLSREEPVSGGPGAPPVVAEDREQAGREHDVAVLGALALLDADDHARAVDGGRAQADGFGDAQAGRVAGGQDGAMGAVLDAGEEAPDFLGTGDDRQLLRLLGGGDGLLDVPVLFQGDAIEEAQGGSRAGDRAWGELPPGREEHLVGPDLLRAQLLGRAAEMAGEPGHLADVGRLGVRRQVPDLHIIRHAAAKGCHGESPLRNRMGCAARGSGPMLPQRKPPGKPASSGNRGSGPSGRT